MGNSNSTNGMFDSTKVARRQYRTFPEAEYVVELESARVKEATTGTQQVLLVWRIRGERYDNLTVFDALNITPDAFEMSVNRVTDMGIDVPVIKGSSAKNVAEKLAAVLSIGHRARARVYETERFGGGGFVRNVRGYLGLPS